MSFRTVLTTASLLLCAGVATAHADSSVMVTYGDLNLSRTEDAKALAGRLQSAAKDVCISANPELVGKPQMQECVDAAIELALAHVQDSMTDSLHANLINARQSLVAP